MSSSPALSHRISFFSSSIYLSIYLLTNPLNSHRDTVYEEKVMTETWKLFVREWLLLLNFLSNCYKLLVISVWLKRKLCSKAQVDTVCILGYIWLRAVEDLLVERSTFSREEGFRFSFVVGESHFHRWQMPKNVHKHN